MGMICCLRRVTQSELEYLLTSPASIEPFVLSTHYYDAADEAPAAPQPGLLARLLGLKPKAPLPPQLPAGLSPPREEDTIDLDRAWMGLHFLLLEREWDGEEPLCYLMYGGRDIGDVDLGYGPARALGPDEVAAFAQALAGISEDDFRDRFDAEELEKEDIYPDLDYLLEHFTRLKSFVQRTADGDLGLVIWAT